MRKRTFHLTFGGFALALVLYLAWSCRAFYLRPKFNADPGDPPELTAAVEAWGNETELTRPAPLEWDMFLTAIKNPWNQIRSRLFIGDRRILGPQPDDPEGADKEHRQRSNDLIAWTVGPISPIGSIEESLPVVPDIQSGSLPFYEIVEVNDPYDPDRRFIFVREFGSEIWEFQRLRERRLSRP